MAEGGIRMASAALDSAKTEDILLAKVTVKQAIETTAEHIGSSKQRRRTNNPRMVEKKCPLNRRSFFPHPHWCSIFCRHAA